MVSLLDVNVVVALAWPNHIHHEAAHRWFRRNAASGWATSPLTQTGFVRVSSNRRVLSPARTPQEAVVLLRAMTSLPHHVFWTDEISIASSALVDASRLLGHHQVTDAHLLAVALSRQGRLATFDRGIVDLVPAGYSQDRVVLIPPRQD
jgi:toxin-antitoxin system PIN domain toxin